MRKLKIVAKSFYALIFNDVDCSLFGLPVLFFIVSKLSKRINSICIDQLEFQFDKPFNSFFKKYMSF
jgi:hypothetical protein